MKDGHGHDEKLPSCSTLPSVCWCVSHTFQDYITLGHDVDDELMAQRGWLLSKIRAWEGKTKPEACLLAYLRPAKRENGGLKPE